MIHRTHVLVSLVLAASSAHSQHIIHHVPPETPEQTVENQRRDQAYAEGWKATVRARKLLDANDPGAALAFDLAAQSYASVPDPSSEAEVEAEWSFESGDYPTVVRLSTKIDQIEGHRDSLLQLAISECRTGHPERALPRLAEWRAMDYCETGKILEADLPVEASVDARSVEATAWLILSYHREAMGRPALHGYLEAQRLVPKSPAVAARLLDVALATGDFALARRSLPLTAASKTPYVQWYQATMAAIIDRREREARASRKAG